MATETRKVLGQVAPSATTDTDLLTVPGSTEYVVSTIMVCNRGSTDATFRVAVAVAGAASDPIQFICYDETIGANRPYPITLGIALAATDKIRVYASTGNLTFQAFGVSIA